jgi:hypothetical protein
MLKSKMEDVKFMEQEDESQDEITEGQSTSLKSTSERGRLESTGLGVER